MAELSTKESANLSIINALYVAAKTSAAPVSALAYPVVPVKPAKAVVIEMPALPQKHFTDSLSKTSNEV